MNVIYSGTRNLYPAMRGAILSLLEHNPDAKVYVLAEDDDLPFEIPSEHEIINVSGQGYFPSSSATTGSSSWTSTPSSATVSSRSGTWTSPESGWPGARSSSAGGGLSARNIITSASPC